MNYQLDEEGNGKDRCPLLTVTGFFYHPHFPFKSTRYKPTTEIDFIEGSRPSSDVKPVRPTQ